MRTIAVILGMTTALVFLVDPATGAIVLASTASIIRFFTRRPAAVQS